MATPSLVWLLTAALGGGAIVSSCGGVEDETKEFRVAAQRTRTSATRCANSPDDTVSSLAKLFGDSVALVNDKVLVKDLEDLPSLEVAHGVYSCGVIWCGAVEARMRQGLRGECHFMGCKEL
jgi:hypothetical protein